MVIYVIRHAAAAEREQGKTDADRPLTDEGTSRMKAVAKALRAIGIAPGVTYTSPLLRARQTADIVAKSLGKSVEVEECDALKPGHSPAEVITFLAKQTAGELAVVGHEPQFGELIALMVTGRTKATVDMKKASVCCVEFDGKPAAGRGLVVWHLVPAIIERLTGT